MGSFLCFGSLSVSCQQAAGPVQSHKDGGSGGLPSPQAHRDGASFPPYPALLPSGAWHQEHFPVVPSTVGLSLPTRGPLVPHCSAPALGALGASVRLGSHLRLIHEHRENTVKSLNTGAILDQVKPCGQHRSGLERSNK